MIRRCAGWVLVLAVLLAAGCQDEPTIGDPFYDYKPQDSPENVVHNLVESYKFRQIEYYAVLLAPEFRFILQPQDALDLGQDFYTHDEDSTGTIALFHTTQVQGIKIDLVYGASVPANDVELPADARKIRVNQVQLQVNETSGISWVVTDVQDMFFRPGRAAAGEDTTTWFLMEWRDLPTALPPRIQPGHQMTWGRLKSLYKN